LQTYSLEAESPTNQNLQLTQQNSSHDVSFANPFTSLTIDNHTNKFKKTDLQRNLAHLDKGDDPITSEAPRVNSEMQIEAKKNAGFSVASIRFSGGKTNLKGKANLTSCDEYD